MGEPGGRQLPRRVHPTSLTPSFCLSGPQAVGDWTRDLRELLSVKDSRILKFSSVRNLFTMRILSARCQGILILTVPHVVGCWRSGWARTTDSQFFALTGLSVPQQSTFGSTSTSFWLRQVRILQDVLICMCREFSSEFWSPVLWFLCRHWSHPVCRHFARYSSPQREG